MWKWGREIWKYGNGKDKKKKFPSDSVDFFRKRGKRDKMKNGGVWSGGGEMGFYVKNVLEFYFHLHFSSLF